MLLRIRVAVARSLIVLRTITLAKSYSNIIIDKIIFVVDDVLMRLLLLLLMMFLLLILLRDGGNAGPPLST